MKGMCLNVNSHKEWLLRDGVKLDEVFSNIPEAGHSVGKHLVPKASRSAGENRPPLTFLGDFCEGFLQRGNRQPTWSRHPAGILFSSRKLLHLIKSYLALVLFDTVQENCLKRKSRVNII